MGYFNTLEVETVLSMLAVIDNPMRDIPLAAVLKSPVVGMSDRELAKMMADYRSCADKGQDRGIYAAASALGTPEWLFLKAGAVSLVCFLSADP